MFGVFVNVGAVVAGSLIGLFVNKSLKESLTSAIMLGVGLCTLYIGFSGALAGQNAIILILSMVIGAVIGTLLDLDGRFNRFAASLEARFQGKGGSGSIAQGFVTASLLFCVGAMTIVGSLQAGLVGDNQMLLNKSVLDFVASIVLSASLGLGVMLAAVFVLVFQGGIVLLAQFVAPFLGDAAIAEMTCVGSVLIFALGFNLIGVTKIKVLDYLPAIFVPIVLTRFL